MIGDTQFVGYRHRVEAEATNAFFLGTAVSVKKLFAREAEFGFLRIPDDVVARFESKRGVAEADKFRQTRAVLKKIKMSDIVEIDEGAHFFRLDEFFRRRIVGGEHDVLTAHARFVRDEEFGQGTAVRTAPFVFEDFQYLRIGKRLHGEVLFEAAIPRERVDERTCLPADTRLVIYIEGRRMLACPVLAGGDKRLHLFFCERKCFCHSCIFATMECTAASIFSRCPNAETRMYPSPFFPKPEPGVVTTSAFSRSSSKNCHDERPAGHLSQI